MRPVAAGSLSTGFLLSHWLKTWVETTSVLGWPSADQSVGAHLRCAQPPICTLTCTSLISVSGYVFVRVGVGIETFIFYLMHICVACIFTYLPLRVGVRIRKFYFLPPALFLNLIVNTRCSPWCNPGPMAAHTPYSSLLLQTAPFFLLIFLLFVYSPEVPVLSFFFLRIDFSELHPL